MSIAGPALSGVERPPRKRPEIRAGQRDAAGTLAVVLVALLFAFPLVLMVLASLRQPGLPPPQGVELVPANPSLRAYGDAFSLVPLARGLLNSALVSAIAVPITIVAASSAALALTLMTGWRRRLLIRVLFLLAMVPVTAVWIPRFVLFGALNLVGTYAPLVAPALMGGSPLFVLLYVVAFRRIPAELFEAARMEGIGPVRIWWNVALPLARPTSGAIALLALALFWSNFIDPLLYLNAEEDLTAPLMLQHLELLGPTNWPVFLAGSVVVTLPVVTATLVAHRFLWTTERGTGWLGR
jgi:multiple sugar transport system permease protein